MFQNSVLYFVPKRVFAGREWIPKEKMAYMAYGSDMVIGLLHDSIKCENEADCEEENLPFLDSYGVCGTTTKRLISREKLKQAAYKLFKYTTGQSHTECAEACTLFALAIWESIRFPVISKEIAAIWETEKDDFEINSELEGKLIANWRTCLGYLAQVNHHNTLLDPKLPHKEREYRALYRLKESKYSAMMKLMEHYEVESVRGLKKVFGILLCCPSRVPGYALSEEEDEQDDDSGISWGMHISQHHSFLLADSTSFCWTWNGKINLNHQTSEPLSF